MKKMLAGFALLALTGAGCLSLETKTDAQMEAKTNTEVKTEGDSAAMVLEGKNAINVDVQKVGTEVTVALATLSKPGYVVIHADANGGPGAIIGQSALLTAGEHTNVAVSGVKIENNLKYWAMIHVDNGDGSYASADDAPVKDDADNIVLMMFQGSADAMMDAKVDVEAKMEADVQVNVEVQTRAVAIQNFAFSEKTLTVKKGDKVTFTNKDSVAHTSTADAGAWESGSLAQNASFTLDTAKLAVGTYTYHCTPHPNMKATLIVE